MPHSKAVKTGSSDGNGSIIHSLSRNLKFLKEWIHFSFNSWRSIRNSSSTILFSCWCLESQGVFKKREGVWGKTSRRLGENTKAFLTVHISLHILILPRQDTISYCDKISNLPTEADTAPCSWCDCHTGWRDADRHGNKPSTWCNRLPTEAYPLPLYYVPDNASRTSHKTRRHP